MSKKLIIAAVVAVLSIGVAAQATESRMDTIGQNTGLSYLADDTGIYANPALLSYYRNMVRIHMGNDDADVTAYGGVSLGLGDMLTLGIFVARNPSNESGLISDILSQALAPGAMPPPLVFVNNWSDYNVGTNLVDDAAIDLLADGAMNWMNPIDIILAAKLGNINLGISYYIATGKHESAYEDDFPTEYSEEMKAKLQSLKLGLAAEMGNIKPQLYFHYTPYKFESTWTDDVANTELSRDLKGRKFVLGARVFVDLNDNLQIVPHIAWQTANGEVSIDSDPDMGDLVIATAAIETEEELIEKYKASQISAGLGINYKAENVLVASSIGLNWGKGTRTLEVDGLDENVTGTLRYLELPIVGLGIEYQATKVLVLRSGISTTTIYAKSRWDESSDVVGALDYQDASRDTYQTTTANAGIGLHFGNLVVDLTAGDMIITGEDAFNSLFSAMDVKYTF